MASGLVQLAEIILDRAKALDNRCNVLGQPFPQLDDPNDPESITVTLDPTVAKAAATIVSAASQLIASVQPPAQYILDASYGPLLSSALRTASISNVPDILASVGPQGSPLSDIAVKTGIDSSKLGRVLRPLVTRHIFKEVAPNVFANNRISSVLTTGQPFEVAKRPEEKYSSTPGLFAISDWLTDEVAKSAVYLPETLLDPATSASSLPTESAFNRAFGVNMDVFAWYELPENRHRFNRFSMAMLATRALSPPSTILNTFEWASLPSGSQIVDVGGGIGSATIPILERYPHLKFEIQDRPAVIVETEQYWKKNHEHAVSDGIIRFTKHDFFTKQPNSQASVFILRYILHDWSDALGLSILSNLRAAASATTKLLVVDFILPDLSTHQASKSILKFDGPITRPYMADLVSYSGLLHFKNNQCAPVQMTAVFNGRERLECDVISLLESAGWKVEAVHSPPGSLERHLVAFPTV
ncbi:O-methyltransferase [Mycena capillaripes]|nr:O-methyltransferase [Mycena capillaripes]